MPPFTDWSTFYQIVGSAAGALTGLQFVSLALIADLPAQPGQAEAGEAFSTPTVFHFATVLVLAASTSAPWHSSRGPSLVWAVAGFLGLGYTFSVARMIRLQNAYKPVFEDWSFHVLLPSLAYLALTLAALLARVHLRPALFDVGAAAVLLLLIGIHNSWDNVTYLVMRKRRKTDA